MTAVDGMFNRGFCVVLPLTILLFLAGIVVLPSYADQAEAQGESAGAEAPAVTHNTWTSGAAMPTAVKFSMTGLIKNQIYVVGGVTETAIVADNQVYNPVSNTWSAAASMPVATFDDASAVVKNILYVFGGSQDGTSATNAVWAYNPKTNSWSPKAAMPTARDGVEAVVEKNIIYVIGGGNSTGIVNTVENYNPATNTWTEEDPLLVAKGGSAIGLIGTTIVDLTGTWDWQALREIPRATTR